MTRVMLIAGIAALSLLPACGEQSAAQTNATTVDVDNGTNVTVPEPATDANAVEGSEASAPSLALAPDGLTIVLESGSTRQASFDMDRDVVVPMVSAALGKPTDTGTNSECGQGPMEMVTFPGGLQMEFQEGKFVGWDYDGTGKGGFTTMNGIGLGSTFAELREAFSGVTAEESTLGYEFSAGDLGGLLSSLKPDATITHIWAGSTCQFR